MSTQNQFGHTLFLHGFESAAWAEKLTRLHLSKNGSNGAPYDEAWLQRLIMRHPGLLPVDHIEPAFSTLIPVCIEMPMRCGSLDNLLVTPFGDLALIECKLWRSPEARREVIAQIIDYAKEMSGWTYETLESAIGKGRLFDGSNAQPTHSLYEIAAAKTEIDEVAFHDNVSRNLKLGRFLLLIVGDGIREGVEAMAEFLQQHAGFHFTLAFVEIALLQAPGGYIAQPRVLAKTTNIERGIVRLDEGRIVFEAIKPPVGSSSNGKKTTTITQERYYEQLETKFPGISPNLNAFLDLLAVRNVFPDYGTDCLILRWRPESGKNWNFASIPTRGYIWTEILGYQAKSAELLKEHKEYLEALKELTGAELIITPTQQGWHVGMKKGDYITVAQLVTDPARRDGWVRAIAQFQDAVEAKADTE